MASVVVVPTLVELVVEVGGVEVDEVDEELEDDELELGGVTPEIVTLKEALEASLCKWSGDAAETVQVPSDTRVNVPVNEPIVQTLRVEDE